MVVRDSVVTRKTQRFGVTWYQCLACDDIGFAYRPLPAIEDERPVVRLPVEPAVDDAGVRIVANPAMRS